MTLGYFSLAHIIYLAIAAGAVTGLYFLVRGKSLAVQRAAVLSVMLLNVIQHLFKMEIYPQYDGGFNALCSAYNMCATLILLSPIAYLSKSETLRDFSFYIGSSAGAVALLIPYWNIGDPAFSPDVIRFFICHLLLLVGSMLPLLLGHHKPSWRAFYRLPLGFFIALVLIIFNDIVFISMGLYPGLSPDNLYESLALANPVWAFLPPEEFPIAVDIAKALSPDILVGENPEGLYAPVLWYFIPVYLGISLVAFPVCAAVDRRNFVRDMRAYKEKISELFSGIKAKFKGSSGKE